MTLIPTDPPLAEPVTLAEAKAHLRVETAAEDDLIADLIAAARAHLEAATGLALISQGWRLCLDDWPPGGVVRLRRAPVQTVEAVTVYDADGMPAVLDTAAAVLDGRARPPRLHLPERPAPGRVLNGIEIEFTAGFGPAGSDVPAELRRALLMHLAHLHEFRGAVPASAQPVAVPPGYERMIAPYARRSL